MEAFIKYALVGVLYALSLDILEIMNLIILP
jgi:hypothetical protein